MTDEIQTMAVEWQPCFRIVPSRFPPISLFEAVANPEDLEAVFEIEAMTNDRLREEVGDIALVAPEDRVSGPGTSPIMAAFTHLNPEGDRFTNGTYGVFYAGKSIKTAIAETKHHRIKFLQSTNEPEQELDMRVYAVDLKADLHDIRGLQASHPAYYHSTNYGMSQELALQLRESGSDGIVYMSVRDAGGECVAVFRARLLSNCRQDRHLCYVWDGKTISTIYEKRAFT
ncbi:RES family NAD+ phosphorylase [Pontibaca salina]|uniref:RES family NAD+ phosphorylase n=1 Tax=Pontibaca salina TaxID=2795731 RepID=A0A934HWD4_9RHOB|nr:RES family NAD+ phosphorylase [Pontibaca salina]